MHREISRIELRSRSSSIDPPNQDAELQARFHDQLHQLFGDDVAQNDPDAKSNGVWEEQADKTNQQDCDDAYDFCLFAKPANVGAQNSHGPRKIAIRSPSPVNKEPGFRNPRRPDNFYFSEIPNTEEAAQLKFAAVSTEQVLKNLESKWKGLEMPWRVIHVTLNGKKLEKESNVLDQGNDGKRKRKGKKSRIVIRKRVQAKAVEKAAANQRLAEKESADKEKRTRKNRERKVKRKQKEKLQKSQGASDDG